MDDFMVMNFFVSIEELGHVEAGFGFGEFGLDDCVHVRRAEFCNEVRVVFGGDDIIESENARFVFQLFEDFDFGLKKNTVDFVFEHFEIDDFDCDWDIYR